MRHVDAETLAEIEGQNLDAAACEGLSCRDCGDTGWIMSDKGWGVPITCHCPEGKKAR